MNTDARTIVADEPRINSGLIGAGKAAFTLIELLVVITIIVVLLALLTPALDKAIQQAELAVCAAQQGGIGDGVIVYAMDHRRYYPYRKLVHDQTPALPNYQPRQLSGSSSGSTENPDGTDERPMLTPYVNVNAYQCPPAGDVELARSDPETIIMSAYSIFYGYKYRDTSSGGGMFKLGSPLGYESRKYHVLLSDFFRPYPSATLLGSAHQDSNGSMYQVERQDVPAEAAFIALAADPDAKTTMSHWETRNLNALGTFDLNFLFDDGSVRRYDDVDHRTSSKADQWNFKRLPVNLKGGGLLTTWLILPNGR